MDERGGEVSKSRQIVVVCVLEDLAFIGEVSKICKLELLLQEISLLGHGRTKYWGT